MLILATFTQANNLQFSLQIVLFYFTQNPKSGGVTHSWFIPSDTSALLSRDLLGNIVAVTFVSWIVGI